MQVAVLTFDRFNEIDTFVALSILNRMSSHGLRAEVCAPTEFVVSMNGVRVQRQCALESCAQADAVLVGSGRGTADAVADDALMARIRLDPGRQWIGSQCSGALVLARKGLLDAMPACTDRTTRPLLEAAGVRVVDAAFHAEGRVATAGGCLAATYLAAWLIEREFGAQAVGEALHYVAPVGELEELTARTLAHVAGRAVPGATQQSTLHDGSV